MSNEHKQRSHALLGWTEQELEEALSKVKQPYYDFEVAAISRWCVQQKYRCHVSLKGDVWLEDMRWKSTTRAENC